MFQKGHPKYGGNKKGSSKKTIWLLESLTQHGYDYEKMLTKFLNDAVNADTIAKRATAERMAYLLVKMVPYLANAPKAERPTVQVETLVINRYDPTKLPQPAVSAGDVIDTTAEVTGHPPADSNENA